MYDLLKAILVDELQMRAEDITPTANCIEVGLDSLGVVELSSVLASRLDIEIRDYELLELATVGDIARLMEERRFAAADGSADTRPLTGRTPPSGAPCQRHDYVPPSTASPPTSRHFPSAGLTAAACRGG